MSPLSRRSTRVVWAWCIAYTAVATPPSRERRRGELRSHLWESEHARLPARAVAFAAVRGVGHDVGWALASGLPRLARSFGTPTPYVVLAPLFPVQAWIVSALTVGTVAHVAEGAGALGGGVMLMFAGLAWLMQRTRG
jgi:hypothetical protein